MARKLDLAIFFILSLFLHNCQSPVPNLDGMWVSSDERFAVVFRNDSLFSKHHFPVLYRLEDDALIFTEKFYPFDSTHVPFKLRDNEISRLLHQDTFVAFEKSAFTNMFDHHVHELGLALALQTGFTEENLESKTYYDFIYVGLSRDSTITIVLNDEKSSLSQVSNYFSTAYYVNDPTTSIAIAADKSILFSEYLKIHNAITKQDSVFVRLKHAIRNSSFREYKFDPFERVKYEGFKLNLASELQSNQDRPFDTLSIEIKNENEVIVNGQTSFTNNLPLLMDEFYAANSKNCLIAILQTESLTYGQFLFIHSLNNKIIFEKRDQYCLENYGKTWPEIQLYDLRIEGSQQLADSLQRLVKQEFPHRILVDDL